MAILPSTCDIWTFEVFNSADEYAYIRPIILTNILS